MISQTYDEYQAESEAYYSGKAEHEMWEMKRLEELEKRIGDYCESQCGTRGDHCRAHGLELSCAICAALEGTGR